MSYIFLFPCIFCSSALYAHQVDGSDVALSIFYLATTFASCPKHEFAIATSLYFHELLGKLITSVFLGIGKNLKLYQLHYIF